MLTSTERFSECRVSVVLGLLFVALVVWLLFTPPVPGERNIAVGVTSLFAGCVFVASAANVRAYVPAAISSVATMLIPRGSKQVVAVLAVGYLLFGAYSIWRGVTANAV
jgi:uncharacterized membrane protein